MGAICLDIRELTVEFAGSVRALSALDLRVETGEIFGLVGETGSGKSTLAWTIVGLLPESARVRGGQAMFGGDDLLRLRDKDWAAIRGRKIGLVVQNARSHLNPLLTVGRQLENAYRAHVSVGRSEAQKEALNMLAAVAMPDPIEKLRAYPHELSGGMAQRAIIALALLHRPALIVADEPTMGLDVTIQAQILDLLREYVRRLGSTCLLVTRDLGVIAQYCDRVGVMMGGELVEVGTVSELFSSPRHPYTISLVRAATFGDNPRGESLAGSGAPEYRRDANSRGCRYVDRCAFASGICSEQAPELIESSGGHLVRCHNEWEVARWLSCSGS